MQAEIDYPSLGLKRGEFAHVVARPDHRVLLEREDGARVAWQPAVATRLGVFVPEVQPLAVGDLVSVATFADDRIFDTPRRVVAIDDRKGTVFVHVEGSSTGYLIDQVEIVKRAVAVDAPT